VREDEAMTRRALDLLGSRRNDAYEAALAALREDTQAWWAEVLARDLDELEEDEATATPDADGLRRFLKDEVLPWFETRKKELADRPLIREQASRRSARRWTRTSWCGSAATSSISTESWSACSPYSCGSRTCGARPSRADPFGKKGRGGLGSFLAPPW